MWFSLPLNSFLIREDEIAGEKTSTIGGEKLPIGGEKLPVKKAF